MLCCAGLLLWLASLTVNAQTNVESTMCYDLEMKLQWREENGTANNNEHFSPPVLVLSDTDFAITGATSTGQLETLAETGNPTPFVALVNSGGTSTAVVGNAEFHPFPTQGTHYTNICFGRDGKQTLRIYSMVAPSPDWFIKVTFSPRPNGGAWPQIVIGTVEVLDAGTDAGKTFTAVDADQSTGTIKRLSAAGNNVSSLRLFSTSSFTLTRVGATALPQSTLCSTLQSPCDSSAVCAVTDSRLTDGTGFALRTCTCNSGLSGAGLVGQCSTRGFTTLSNAQWGPEDIDIIGNTIYAGATWAGRIHTVTIPFQTDTISTPNLLPAAAPANWIFGVATNTRTNTVAACYNTPNIATRLPGQYKIIEHQLPAGNAIREIPVDSCGDLVYDAAGNIFVSAGPKNNAENPVVYRIAPAATTPQVYARDGALKTGATGSQGPSGIVVTSTGTLLIGVFRGGNTLARVRPQAGAPLPLTPEAVTIDVGINGTTLAGNPSGIDGMVLYSDTVLIVVSDEKVKALFSSNGWERATVNGVINPATGGCIGATAPVLYSTDVYVSCGWSRGIDAQLNVLPNATYRLQRAGSLQTLNVIKSTETSPSMSTSNPGAPTVTKPPSQGSDDEESDNKTDEDDDATATASADDDMSLESGYIGLIIAGVAILLILLLAALVMMKKKKKRRMMAMREREMAYNKPPMYDMPMYDMPPVYDYPSQYTTYYDPAYTEDYLGTQQYYY